MMRLWLLAIALFAGSSAAAKEPLTLELQCTIHQVSSEARQLTVKIDFYGDDVRHASLRDQAVELDVFYSHGKPDFDTLIVFSWPLPDGKRDGSKGQRNRVYTLDYESARFGYSTMTIAEVVKPKPNVVTDKSIVATGICKSISEKAAS